MAKQAFPFSRSLIYVIIIGQACANSLFRHLTHEPYVVINDNAILIENAGIFHESNPGLGKSIVLLSAIANM